MFTLSTGDRRALRRGAIVVALALAWSYGVRPSMERRALLADQLDVERAVLAREQAMVRADALRAASGGSDSAARALPGRLFTGADEVMATADVVEYLGDAARRHDVWMQAANTRPAAPATAGLRALTVELRAEADVSGLLHFLGALEQGPRLVHVTSLDVRGAAAATDDGTNPLAISATVRGYAPGGASPARAAGAKP